MLHLFRFLFWGFGLACIAWIIKQLSDEQETPATETLCSRIRNSGF